MHEYGTQVKELKGQNQQLLSELHLLKEGMTELQSCLKSNLAQPHESPEDFTSRHMTSGRSRWIKVSS
jgi:hypothetical protein